MPQVNGRSSALTGALIGAVVALVLSTVAAYAAFFTDAVPRTELKQVEDRVRQNEKDIAAFQGEIRAWMRSVDQRLCEINSTLKTEKPNPS